MKGRGGGGRAGWLRGWRCLLCTPDDLRGFEPTVPPHACYGTQTATPAPKLITATKESCVQELEQGNKLVLVEDVSEEVAFQTHPER